MIHVKKVKQTLKEGDHIMTVESTCIESDHDDLFELNYANYRFDKEGMEYMAREAARMLEEYSMRQELEELEEENYFALSERYRKYSMLDLFKKLFM